MVSSSFKARLQVLSLTLQLYSYSTLISKCMKWRNLCMKFLFQPNLAIVSQLSTIPFQDHSESGVRMHVCVQPEAESPAPNTDGCDLSRNSTGNSTSKSTEDVTSEQCRQAGEDIPRGMVVATTDLQMRSLTQEDEEEVGFSKIQLRPQFASFSFHHLT